MAPLLAGEERDVSIVLGAREATTALRSVQLETPPLYFQDLLVSIMQLERRYSYGVSSRPMGSQPFRLYRNEQRVGGSGDRSSLQPQPRLMRSAPGYPGRYCSFLGTSLPPAACPKACQHLPLPICTTAAGVFSQPGMVTLNPVPRLLTVSYFEAPMTAQF